MTNGELISTLVSFGIPVSLIGYLAGYIRGAYKEHRATVKFLVKEFPQMKKVMDEMEKSK